MPRPRSLHLNMLHLFLDLIQLLWRNPVLSLIPIERPRQLKRPHNARKRHTGLPLQPILRPKKILRRSLLLHLHTLYLLLHLRRLCACRADWSCNQVACQKVSETSEVHTDIA